MISTDMIVILKSFSTLWGLCIFKTNFAEINLCNASELENYLLDLDDRYMENQCANSFHYLTC